MKSKIIAVTKHPLISMSFVIFTGSLTASFFNFLFNLFMSRNLTVADYGALTSLVSLITLAIIPAGALIPTVVHFSAAYFAKGEEGKAYALFFKVGKLCLAIGITLMAILVFFSAPIAAFFHISDSSLLIIPGFIVFFSYLATINSGMLQAKLSFGYLSFSQLLGSLTKLLLGTLFVFLGYSVMGAMWAFFLSYFIPYLITFIPLRFLFNKQIEKSTISVKELLVYGMPSALTLIALTSFITVDTLIVKHFFEPTSAGIYAGISLLGRIIFFFSAPIGTVMFPLVVQKFTKNESYINTLLLAVFLVFTPSVLLTIFYFLIPEFVIQMSLKNDIYLSGAALLGPMGIYMSIYSVLYLLANYALSIKRTNVWLPIAIGSVAQILLLWLFHDSFIQVVIISTLIVVTLLVILILYLHRYAHKKP